MEFYEVMSLGLRKLPPKTIDYLTKFQVADMRNLNLLVKGTQKTLKTT